MASTVSDVREKKERKREGEEPVGEEDGPGCEMLLGRSWAWLLVRLAGSGLSLFFLTNLLPFFFSLFFKLKKKQAKTFYKNLQKYFLESFSIIE